MSETCRTCKYAKKMLNAETCSLKSPFVKDENGQLLAATIEHYEWCEDYEPKEGENASDNSNS